MKPKYKFLLVPLICFFFLCSGCKSIEFNVEDTIKPPVNVNATIQGTWKIEKFTPIVNEHKDIQKLEETKRILYVGKEAIFDNEIAAVGREVCINPKYKIIRTPADTFVHNKYRINKESLGLKNDKVNVFTITSNNQFFYEIIVTDKMIGYIYFEDGFLVLNKISDVVDEKLKESSFGNVGMNVEDKLEEDPLLRSGVLIGIRSYNNKYRTLWIYSKNREIKAVSYREQLMVPRAKGFWEIGTITNKDGNESIYAEPFGDATLYETSQNGKKNNSLTEMPGTKMLFIGNDYIGIEHNLKLSVLATDNLSVGKGVAFSDIVNENSYNAFEQSSDAFVSTLDSDESKKIIRVPNEENFTLKRRNGHWIIKSRLYYKEPFKGQKYEDFDLNLMVPSELIHYDEMNIPWNSIKSKLPWITDAYMSPNKDIALLVSNDSLHIYPVQNKSIVNRQIENIPLSKGDSIIMTEWAIGKYADIWSNFTEKSFAGNQESWVNY